MSGFVAQTSPLAENWLCLAQSADFQAAPVFSTRWASFRIFCSRHPTWGNLALLVKFLSQPPSRKTVHRVFICRLLESLNWIRSV
jgi:hypothetical protein